MGKVIGIGETVTDIIIRNGIPQNMVCGGSCLNAMVSLGRSGLSPLFVSEVGDDKLGCHTIDFLRLNNVVTDYVNTVCGKKSKLSLAFLDENNDAQYEFFQDVRPDAFPCHLPVVEEGDIILCGSFYALNPLLHPDFSAYLHAAGQSGAVIYYDLNFRPTYLSQRDSLNEQLNDNFNIASIVRGSDEDFRNIFGSDDVQTVYDKIREHCSVLILTRGSHGVDLATPSLQKHYDIDAVKVVSSIGAGDTFNAGVVLSLASMHITKQHLPAMDEQQWDYVIQIATMMSAEVCGMTENYISKQTGKRLKSAIKQ